MKAPIKKNNTNSTAASCLRDAPTPGKSPRSLGKGFREGSEDFCAKTPFGSPIPWPCSRAGAALPRPSWGSAPKPVPAPGARGKSPKTQSLDPIYCSPGTGEISQGKETASKPHVGKRCPAPGPQRGAKHVGWVLNPATAPRDAGGLPKFSPSGWLPASPSPQLHFAQTQLNFMPKRTQQRLEPSGPPICALRSPRHLCLRLQIGAKEAKVIIFGILRTGGEEKRRPGWAAHERAAWSLRAAGHLHAPNRPGQPQKHRGWGSHPAPPRLPFPGSAGESLLPLENILSLLFREARKKKNKSIKLN